ncbi:MAG: type II secretion system F family protein, partial [Candidatus Eremiobacterota bacterium]
FTRQLTALLESGMPVHNALETLVEQDDPVLGRAVEAVLGRVLRGSTLSASLSRFPGVFPPLYVSMVQVGEKTGALPHSLSRLAQWLEREERLAGRVRSALAYPAFVLALSALLTVALFLVVLPGFVGIFRDLKVELPLLTRLILGLTTAIRSPGAWLVTAGLCLPVGLALREFLASPPGRRWWFRVAVAIPVLGGMLQSAALARMCAAMQALLNANVDLLTSLHLGARASGNPLIEESGARMVRQLSLGARLADALAGHRDLFPGVVSQMVAAGEETSRLGPMLRRLSEMYDQDLDYRIEALGSILEPILILAVGLAVGTIMVAVFLPLYGHLNHLGV